MKAIIKIFTILTFGIYILNPNCLNAQECPRNDPAIKIGAIIIDPGNSTHLEIPEKWKSRLNLEDLNENNSKTGLIFIEKLGGCTSVIFDNEDKIVAIVIPENSTVPKDYLITSYQDAGRIPFPKCLGENEYNIPCVVGTVILKIMSWFD